MNTDEEEWIGGDVIRIKDIRKKLNISPDEFAKGIGTNKISYYYKLKGRYQWTIKEIINLWKISGEEIELDVDGKSYIVHISEK